MRVPRRGSDVRRRYSLRYTSRSTSHESSGVLLKKRWRRSIASSMRFLIRQIIGKSLKWELISTVVRELLENGSLKTRE